MSKIDTTNVRLSPPPPQLMRLVNPLVRRVLTTRSLGRRNFAGGAPVTVTHRGRVRRGRALLLEATPAEAGAAFRAAPDDGATPFELGLKVPRGYEPTEADLATIARSLIRVDYDD